MGTHFDRDSWLGNSSGRCGPPASWQFSGDLWLLLDGCLRLDAHDRLSMEQVLKHPWFAGNATKLHQPCQMDHVPEGSSGRHVKLHPNGTMCTVPTIKQFMLHEDGSDGKSSRRVAPQ